MSNEVRHTPGPWQMEDSGSQGVEINATNADTGKWSAVARVEPENCLGSRRVSESEAEANAHLVAAAPRLLAALKTLVEECRDSNDMRLESFSTALAVIMDADNSHG